MSPIEQAEWFTQRTQDAPPDLRARAQEFFDAAAESGLSHRLATAGERALAAATGDGIGRAAALDLLAADALITLALLATAEQAPDQLERVAAELRVRASALT